MITCKTDKRAGKNVTGGADAVTVFKNNLSLLKKELMNIKPPEGLEDMGNTCQRKNSSEDGLTIIGGATSVSPAASASGSSTSIYVPAGPSMPVFSSVPMMGSSVISISKPNAEENKTGSSAAVDSFAYMNTQEPSSQESPSPNGDQGMKSQIIVLQGDPMEEDDKVPMDM